MFLAPETFFLLVVMVQGFRAYAADFFRYHGADGSRLSPIRITGSALELVFCNLRQLRGNADALDAARYSTAKASYSVMQECNADQSAYASGKRKLDADSRHSLTPKTRKQGLKELRQFGKDVTNTL